MPGLLEARNIDDLRQLAQQKLPRGLFEFVDRGTDDDHALRAIPSAFDAIHFHPHVLAEVSRRSATSSFVGKPSAMHLAIAPTGAAGLLHFDGEIALARAPARAGVPFTL